VIILYLNITIANKSITVITLPLAIKKCGWQAYVDLDEFVSLQNFSSLRVQLEGLINVYTS